MRQIDCNDAGGDGRDRRPGGITRRPKKGTKTTATPSFNLALLIAEGNGHSVLHIDFVCQQSQGEHTRKTIDKPMKTRTVMCKFWLPHSTNSTTSSHVNVLVY